MESVIKHKKEVKVYKVTGWQPNPQFVNGNAEYDLLFSSLPNFPTNATVIGASGYSNNAPWAYAIINAIKSGADSLRVWLMTTTTNPTVSDTFTLNIYYIQ